MRPHERPEEAAARTAEYLARLSICVNAMRNAFRRMAALRDERGQAIDALLALVASHREALAGEPLAAILACTRRLLDAERSQVEVYNDMSDVIGKELPG